MCFDFSLSIDYKFSTRQSQEQGCIKLNLIPSLMINLRARYVDS